MITLKIQETNNTLKFKEHYEPVVCGNSNYLIEFEFGEDWQNTNSKVAVLDLAGLKTAINFDGNILALPPLDAPPSAKTLELYLMSAETEIKTLITNTIVIDIIPTHHIQNLPEFEPLESHVSELLKKIDELTNGTLKLATSKHAETANVAYNVSNPNLLINGNFKVNQRGQTTYTETGKYTVDRWKLVSGTVEVVSGGIKLNGTIMQKLEHTPSMQVVASSNAGEISYSSGAVTLSTTTATLITYAKLEVGSTPTLFSPKTYAEEFALCQRFYQIYYGYKVASNGYSYYEPNVVFNIPMRTGATKKMFAVNGSGGKSGNENTVFDITGSEELGITSAVFGYGNERSFVVSNGNGTFLQNHHYRFVIYADAEIY